MVERLPDGVPAALVVRIQPNLHAHEKRGRVDPIFNVSLPPDLRLHSKEEAHLGVEPELLWELKEDFRVRTLTPTLAPSTHLKW